MALHHHQRPGEIGRVVGCEAKLAAGFQLGGEQVDGAVVDHPPLGVARLGPRVGMEQVKEAQTPIGHALEHLKRVAAPQADIAQMLLADVRERGGDSVEERLGADEAVVGKHVGAVGEMLARAKADLEMERPFVPEQPPRRDLAFGRHLDLWQQLVDELLLALAQLVPARAAVQPVEGQRVAGFERGHGAPAPRAGGVD